MFVGMTIPITAFFYGCRDKLTIYNLCISISTFSYVSVLPFSDIIQCKTISLQLIAFENMYPVN